MLSEELYFGKHVTAAVRLRSLEQLTAEYALAYVTRLREKAAEGFVVYVVALSPHYQAEGGCSGDVA
jgi:hypothetical protein